MRKKPHTLNKNSLPMLKTTNNITGFIKRRIYNPFRLSNTFSSTWRFCICSIILILITSSCHTSKKVTNYNYTIEEEKKIEKEEVEEKLHGTEKRILEEAFEWLETPYAYGRQDKGVATDCSGLVMVVFEKAANLKLPRNSAKQAEFSRKIKPNEVKPCDLVFFITNGGEKINHVGIMIDKEKFIHASTHGVRVSSMASDYYKQHFVMFGRVL